MGISQEHWGDDRTEREFEECGLECFTRTHGYGHRCGYVAVPKGHPLFGLSYDQIYDRYDIDVDGGLTFAEPMCGKWVIGWDASHAWHKRDTSIMDHNIRRFYAVHPEHIYQGGLLVDADMAEAETRRLARQVARIGGSDE